MSGDELDDCSVWSREHDKIFENALATYPEDSIDRWERIAADVPGKSIEEIKHHYELLVDDVNQIESGFVPLPWHSSSSDGSTSQVGDEVSGKKAGKLGKFNGDPNHGCKASKSDQERRKGIAWTEDEHRLFLLGLDKYGKGDWRSISRNFVVTRTPTQVASHAQKYFIRLNSMNKDRRRSSIHDITSVNNDEVVVPQEPIAGETNCSSRKPGKQPPQSSTGTLGVGMYGGTTLVSAVGTPVNLPQAAHMAYGVRALVPGQVVTGAPVNIGNMAYSMPETSSHR